MFRVRLPCPAGPMEKFNRTAQLLIDALLTDHPEWRPYALPYGPADDREAHDHSVRFSIPVPGEGRHRLEVALRGHTIEVAYDCGEVSVRADRGRGGEA